VLKRTQSTCSERDLFFNNEMPRKSEGRLHMQQNSKKTVDEDSRKLALVVVLLSMFVAALFSFAPLV
jgi:hypothetical protein